MSEVISSGLTLTIPTLGDTNWSTSIRNNCFVKISEHDHTGSGKGLQIATGAIAANAVTFAKLNSDVSDASSRSKLASIGQLQDAGVLYAGTTAGTPGVQTATLTPAITAYATGQRFAVLIGSNLTNTSTGPTINFNSVGAKTMVRSDGSSLAAGDLVAGTVYILQYDGTSFRVMKSGDTVLSRSSTAVTIVSSTTETTLATTTVKAGTLVTTRAVRMVVSGYVNNNTGSDKDVTIRLKFGATTIFSKAITITTSAASRMLHVIFEIYADAATNAQTCYARVAMGAAIAGTNDLGAATVYENWEDLAEDTTADKSMVVTAELSANSASLTCVKKYTNTQVL